MADPYTPLFDEGVDAPFDPANPLANAPQQPQPRVLKRSLSVRERGPIDAGAEDRQRARDLLEKSLQGPTEEEIASMREYAKRRDAQAQRDFERGMFLQAFGGSSFSPIGAQVLKQALANQAPEKIGGGIVQGGQFIVDPEQSQQRRQQRLEAQAKIYESMAQHADTLQQRQEAAQMAAELRAALAGNKQPNLQHIGRTPSGEIVGYDRTTNQQIVNGQPYNGPVMSQAALDKQAAEVQQAIGHAQRYGQLIKVVQSNPKAFSGASPLLSLAPDVVASRARAGVLSPDEYQAYAMVQQEASQLLNEIFGAAVSAGEMHRATPWVPQPTDNLATTLNKLKAARAWQEQKAKQYGAAMQGVAQSRMNYGQQPGAAPSGAPAAPSGPTSWNQLPPG